MNEQDTTNGGGGVIADLDFTPRKPVKCKHCGFERMQHRAQTFQCPAKWSKSRALGHTHFLETVFEPRPSPGQVK